MVKKLAAVILYASLMLSVWPASGFASDIVEKTVRFSTGSNGTTINDQIVGYKSISYLLGASSGQVMTVTLRPTNNATYFNIYSPGKGPGDEALANSSIDGPMVPDLNQFSGILPSDGEYTISVYMMRSAARRNEKSNFTLDISISAKGTATQLPDKIPVPASGDVLVPGTDFNATGIISCARSSGQAMGNCEFGVKRESNENGSITVFWPDGGIRVIFYEAGVPAYYAESEADGGSEMTTGKDNDLFKVAIGQELFEIPDVVITGD